jgi:cellulose synthase/poly-beta-1,6-N-acetylglucosamine synthase-like glycosyltransferase
MWLTSTLVYWSSLGLVAYTYAGYPLIINALARLRPKPTRASDIEPSVTFVLAARDEADRIAAKLDNLLALDYPSDKVEVVVVSDGSTDGTDEIVAAYRDRGVVLVRLDPPGGKAIALNHAMQRARGEVVVFCDARQRVDQGALRAIVPLFADPRVGAVSGELVLESERGPGAYWLYEKLIRAAEGRVDSVVGATGALYAIRRHLFKELPRGTLLDDVYTPLQIVLEGYRVLFQPEARVYDEEADVGAEFSRKARTLAGNFQLLEQLPAILNPVRNRVFLQYVSHKLLRLVCPYALAGLLGANIVLVLTGAPGWPLYAATLGGQLAGYGLALKGALQGEGAGRLGRLSYTFVTLNLAAVEGLRRYLAGELSWTSARSAELPRSRTITPPATGVNRAGAPIP